MIYNKLLNVCSLCLTTDYYSKDDKKDYRGPNYFTYPRECGKELSKLHGASKWTKYNNISINIHYNVSYLMSLF